MERVFFVIAASVGCTLWVLDSSFFTYWRLRAHRKTALLLTLLWVLSGLSLAGLAGAQYGNETSIEFLATYSGQFSISLAYVYVVHLVLWALAIPGPVFKRLLTQTVFVATVARLGFVWAGYRLVLPLPNLMRLFDAALVVVGFLFLLKTERQSDILRNWVVRMLQRALGMTPELPGKRYFIRLDGKRKATPLFIAAIVLSASTVIFAAASVPAAHAVTDDLSTAILATLWSVIGLQALYFVAASRDLRFLKPALTLIFVYLGVSLVIRPWLHLDATHAALVMLGAYATSAAAWYVAKRRPSRPVPLQR